MPPRKYKHKIKRSYKKKYNRKPRTAKGSIFPRTRTTTLRYAQSYVFTGEQGSGSVSVAQIQLNSCHSPEGSYAIYARQFTNAQPYLYDQIRPMYDNYCVVKTKVKCTWACEYVTKYSADYIANPSFIALLRDCDDNSTLPSDTQLEMVRPNAMYKVTTSGKPVSISKTYDIAKLAGISRAQLLADPSNWGGSVSSSSPTNIYYANAVQQAIGSNINRASVLVEIHQTVVFIGPTQVGMS